MKKENNFYCDCCDVEYSDDNGPWGYVPEERYHTCKQCTDECNAMLEAIDPAEKIQTFNHEELFKLEKAFGPEPGTVLH